jgi:hypothetical protein
MLGDFSENSREGLITRLIFINSGELLGNQHGQKRRSQGSYKNQERV